MKFLIISFFSLFSIFSYSKELSCSRNGTNVFYINGVLSKGLEETILDSKEIQEIFKSHPGLLDSQSKVSFIPIYNPSNGPLNDIAELYAEDYYYRTGKDDGFSVFMQIYQAKLNKAANPSMLKKITQGGYLKQLKYKAERLKALAAERKYITTPLAVDQLKKINATVVNSVVSKMDESIRDGKKSLFIAHSQGNAVIKEAFRRASINENYQDYFKKFNGVFHMASPVQNLPVHTTNVRSLLLSNDWIVNLANYVFPEFNRGPATHILVSSDFNSNSKEFDEFNHLFSNVYISKDAKSKSFLDSTTKDMQTIFKETLSDLATDLEDNCYAPEIKISASNAAETSKHVFKIPSAGQSTRTPITVADLNNDSGTTIFTISYSEYRYDPNTYPFNIFHQTTIEGNTVSIPIPFASANYSVNVSAYNPETKKSATASAIISAKTDAMPTINPVVDCDKRVDTNGNLINSGTGVVRVGANDSDSSEIYIGVWYPNQETGIYEGNFTDNAYNSPNGYFYGFENFFFNEREYVYSVDFAGRNDIRIIYENSNGKVGYASVVNSCKNN